MTPEQKAYAIDQYVNHGKTPQSIQADLGLKYFQPIYTLLKKEGVFVHRSNVEKSIRRYTLDERFFEVIDSEAKAYSLGFIIADGHLDEKARRVKIALHEKDVDILVKMSEAMGSTSPIAFIASKNQRSVCFNSALMVADLKRFGLTSNKSLTMDDQAWGHIPEDLKRHFIRGYLDGDGSLFLNRRYSSGVKYLVQVIGTESFLRGTFDKYYPTTCKLYKYKTCEMYCWKLSSRAACMDFLAKIYENSTISLDRKFKQYAECAHVKPSELSGNPNGSAEGNQQPSNSTESAGSETIETTA
jgi:hypothetical protein